MTYDIPTIDIGPLFAPRSTAREQADAELMSAAANFGFFVATGLPPHIPTGTAARADLLRLFQLSDAQIRQLWRQKFAPSNANVYRGFFPLQPGNLTAKEGIDMGGDILYGESVIHERDPLRERTPLPPPEALPGWHQCARDYYAAMEQVSRILMQSLARGLNLQESFFDDSFERGLSTLRLLRYPIRLDADRTSVTEPGVWICHEGRRFYIMGAAHVDSGFLTLLAQDGISGLQARHRDGTWIDVPPLEHGFAVNFGKVLERWSAGRIRATEHRVIGNGRERMSIPFFYEARADAQICPLPIDPEDAFEPFIFGDYLWATTTQFVEFQGMERMRKPFGMSSAK